MPDTDIFNEDPRAGFTRFRGKDEPEDRDRIDWVTSADRLREIAARVCESESVAPEDRERVRGFRTRTSLATWSIANIIPDKATPDIWEGHVRAAIAGAIRDVFECAGQNNGNWMLLHYTIAVGRPKGVKEERFGIKMTVVDTTGNDDLRFENNRLVVSSGVSAGTALKALAPAAEGNAELTAALLALTKALAAKEGIALPTTERAQPTQQVASEKPAPVAKTADRAKGERVVAVHLPSPGRQKPGPKPKVKVETPEG